MTQNTSPLRAGLIGAGIQQSLTPSLHEREGAEQGLRYTYHLIDLEQRNVGIEALPGLITEAEREGFCGLNITHPCKQAVIPLLHELSPDAQALGAVNTVVLNQGRRIGHNTDWSGFAENFTRYFPNEPRSRIVQLGAGGGGSAVAYAMLRLGAGEVGIYDTDGTRAEQLAAKLRPHFGAHRITVLDDYRPALALADGLINTTPVGMAKYPGPPVSPEHLRKDLWVADIVYFPLETELLRNARAAGCRTLDGGGMAVFQAVEAFRLFTGLTPVPERMLRHFRRLTQQPVHL